MYLGENIDNLSETKNVIYFQPFLKMRKFLLDMRKDFLIMSNFYLVEILSEPNSLTIVTSKKILKMSNYMLILSIFFLIMRIRNLQCTFNMQFLYDLRHKIRLSKIVCGIFHFRFRFVFIKVYIFLQQNAWPLWL